MAVHKPEPDHTRAHHVLHKIAQQAKGAESTQDLIGKLEKLSPEATKLLAEQVDAILAAADKPAEPTLPHVE